MRFTSYTRYNGSLADALNLESLLEQLSDFLLQSGFAGGPYHHPYWGEFGGDEGDRSLDALREALLRALLESGQLTPEMVARTSPARFQDPGGVLHAWVGGDESEEFHRQNELIRQQWGPRTVPVCAAAPGTNHFTVLHELATPDSAVHQSALDLLGLR